MLIALTGGVGCGKSTTLKIFSQLGWSIFDSDKECHKLYDGQNPNFVKNLIQKFGSDILLDGKVSRKLIAEKVFNNNKDLEWLNSNIHPIILKKIKEQYSISQNKRLICDIPLLFECGWEHLFDYTISVWSSMSVQVNRLKNKRQWDKEKIKKRLDNQMSIDVKLRNSSFGIINNSSPQLIEKQCKIINNKIGI